MTFGVVFAAILAVLAAAEDPERAAQPGGSGAEIAADPGSPPAESATEPEAAVAAPEGTALSEAGPILIGRVERANGWALERLLEPSGDIVEHEVNRAGTVQSCRKVGSLFTMRIIDQRPAPGGEVVHVVRDASGAILRLAVGKDGEPRAVALVAPPPPR
jgi:hypothetical protein